ncbi:ABC transporter permease [Algoriphagus sp. CAU 1675]|uniref:ABC transporter permease n=1 Tax=Algoriphagus sp. CAU 1675 TaxID=3032597 RepID=UPI0023DC24B2|nr:ABC transporter permease [Algoriphagus sp. CAU 1675]MDF2158133.1 ABC transporter permease [Algoriphagus sp. CAU 1675]
MLRHQILLAFRGFLKHKHIFLINLFGLTTGLTTVVLIMFWVKDELSINRYHNKIDRIYSVLTNHNNANGLITIDYTPAPMAEALKEEFPQVELATGLSPYIDGVMFESGENSMEAEGYFVDQDYFGIFDIDFLAGSKENALTGINSVVLSESLASKLFGSPAQALGKSLHWQVFDFQNEVEVTGVYRDYGDLDIRKPEYLLAFPYFLKMLGDGAHWDNFNSSIHLLLRKGSDVEQFNEQIHGFIKSKNAQSNVSAFVQPFGDTYLYGSYEEGKIAGGRISYVRIFSGIAVFILLIACINFMNLTTARSMSRLKEIGVKKSMGASRGGLFTQFITESLMLSLFALLLALLATFLLQPLFNQLTSKSLELAFQLDVTLILFGIWVVTGLMAGIYPAVYLSRFKPVEVMKSNVKGSFGELLARKGLVVFQFGISLLLIIGIAVLGKQMSFVQSQNLGYDQAHLLELNSSSVDPQKLEALLEQVKTVPGVSNASSLSHPLVGLSSSTIGLSWDGKDPEDQIKFENITVNMGLIETMGFQILQGRSFSPDFGEEQSKIILNEAAVKTIGFLDPVGQIVNLWGNDMEVIGVIKDFHFESLKETVKPAFLKYDSDFAQKILIRIESENQAQTIAGISQVYEGISGQTLNYKFMDEDYQSLYASEQRTLKLANYFGASAIFLSCLGLFGLAAFTAEKRKKEIGVRKVMGASTFGILSLVSRDFVGLILISIVIASPIAWYFSNIWLESYAFRTDLNWWIFAGAGLVLVLISLLTVGYQAFKAATANPVTSLRSE